MKILTIIFAVLLPPVGVALHRGVDKVFLLNILLTLCGGIPGMIHALYVVLVAKQ